jgi:hypothetical protein
MFECRLHKKGDNTCGIVCEFKRRVREIDRHVGYNPMGKHDYENAKKFMIVRHSNSDKQQQTTEVSWHLTKNEAEALCRSQFVSREKYDFEGNWVYITYAIEEMKSQAMQIEWTEMKVGPNLNSQYVL